MRQETTPAAIRGSTNEKQPLDISMVDAESQRKQLFAAMIIHLNELNFQLTKGLHNFGSTRGMGEKT